MESGLFKAGRILVLVGAILNMVGAVVLILAGAAMMFVTSAAQDMALGVVGGVYLVLGIISVAGAIFGFVAHDKARRGDAHGAWVMGLVSSLMPPLQVVTLIGAILLLTSPEHDAQRRPSSISRPS